MGADATAPVVIGSGHVLQLNSRVQIRAQRVPKAACPHCYGRGQAGTFTPSADPTNRRVIVCKCVGHWEQLKVTA